MGAGYTRQAQDNIVDGAVIDSDDLNAEFNQVEAAFNSTTGHTHDGTEGEGPQIDTAGLADDAVTGAKIDSTTTVTAASFVGPLTGDVTGNADTATALETARTIAGQSFDGTANITIAPTDLTGVTATASELNILDDAIISTTELNYLDGVTSNIQTQIDNVDVPNDIVTTDASQYDSYNIGSLVVFSNAEGTAIDRAGGYAGSNFLRLDTFAWFNVDNFGGVTAGRYDSTNGPTAVASGVIRIGNDAGDEASDSSGVFIGDRSGKYASGSRNVGVGTFTLNDAVFTGDDNVAIGYFSGYSIESGSNNICIGKNAGWITSPSGNITTASNIICMGDDDITNAYINVAWTNTSDARDKTDFEDLSVGLDFINSVEPKTFHFDHRSQYYVYDNDGDIIEMPEPDGTHKTTKKFLGFSAQQVQEAVEATGFPDQIIIDSSDPEHYKMKETAFIPALVKAVQELSARVEQLEAQLNSQ